MDLGGSTYNLLRLYEQPMATSLLPVQQSTLLNAVGNVNTMAFECLNKSGHRLDRAKTGYKI